MRVRISLLVLLTVCSIGLLQGQDFTLDQIAHHLPSAGFETPIQFWTRMFTQYGERDVVFHDRRDLRIVYEVVSFERGTANDVAEERRQRRKLRAKALELRSVLNDLRRGWKRRDLGPEHRKILDRVTELGYEPTASLFRRLRDEIRYQRGIQEKFRQGIVRSGRYLEEMIATFREMGLPEELALLPHIESSFEYGVRSRAGAAGIWQFVRSTGRGYMTINWYVDERLDPLESTRAAARLLKENYEALGTWPLAITAYNHGRNGMMRAKRLYGTDLLTITQNYRSRLFGFASRNFYPEFLATVEVVANQEHYFGPLEVEPPLSYETLELKRSYHVSHFTSVPDLDEDVLREYNPSLTHRAWRDKLIPAGVTLRVPPESRGRLVAALEEAAPISDLQVGDDGAHYYRVQRGDSLGTIAVRFGTSISSLQAVNGIQNRHRIYEGQVLRIPGTPGRTSERPTRYRVQWGDTLHEIARRFQTSIERIIEANNLSNPHRIFLGQVLVIP